MSAPIGLICRRATLMILSEDSGFRLFLKSFEYTETGVKSIKKINEILAFLIALKFFVPVLFLISIVSTLIFKPF